MHAHASARKFIFKSSWTHSAQELVMRPRGDKHEFRINLNNKHIINTYLRIIIFLIDKLIN